MQDRPTSVQNPQKFMTDKEVRHLISKFDLDGNHQTSLRASLQQRDIQHRQIRDILCEAGQQCNEAYYILEGTINLADRHDKIVFSQVGKGEVVNLQAALCNWHSKYRIVCTSSVVTFVPLLRKEAEILASKCEKNLKAIICFREREASERCKDSVKMLFKDRQDIRDRLDLPDIVKKHSSTQCQQAKTFMPSKEMVRRNQEILGNKIGDLAISPLNGKLLGHRSIKSYNGVRTFAAEDEKSEQPPLKRLNSQIFLNYGRVKQAEGHTLSPKIQQIIGPVRRTEKLFKEQLRQIFRRKVAYEKKNFKVLHNIEMKNSSGLLNGNQHNRHEMKCHKLDDYFDIR